MNKRFKLKDVPKDREIFEWHRPGNKAVWDRKTCDFVMNCEGKIWTASPGWIKKKFLNINLNHKY